MQEQIRTVIMRGGTSRGLFFRAADLPAEPALRDRLILAAFGSPDPYGRQLDGLGGATSTTSKVAIIGRPTVEGADVDYTFGQVSIGTALVDYKGNCGNISSAVGPYAIDEGLVRVEQPYTTVRIHNTNTRKIIAARVPVAGGRAAVEGDYAIDGVPGTGARIALDFEWPGGAVTGLLLPTGSVRDVLAVANVGSLTVSVVDAANPVAFVRATDLGLAGTELPATIDGTAGLLDRIEAIRGTVAVRLGLADSAAEATRLSPAVPKIALVAPPTTYTTTRGTRLAAVAVDLVARIMSMQRTHQAYAITGGICTAVAASIPGTVVHEVARPWQRPGVASTRDVRIGHPAGTIEVGSVVDEEGGLWVVQKAVVYRTARRLADGWVYVRRAVYQAGAADRAVV